MPPVLLISVDTILTYVAYSRQHAFLVQAPLSHKVPYVQSYFGALGYINAIHLEEIPVHVGISQTVWRNIKVVFKAYLVLFASRLNHSCKSCVWFDCSFNCSIQIATFKP